VTDEPTSGEVVPGRSARTITIVGFVLAAGAFLVYPLFLGPLAILAAYVGRRQGDRLGRMAMIAGAVAIVASIAVGVLITVLDDTR